jgi:hypothetical protein
MHAQHAQPAALRAPRGRIQTLSLGALPGQQYLRYVPASYCAQSTALVFIHGYTRQADAQLKALLSLSEARGCALLAPVFDRVQHPRYQRLGRSGFGARADAILDACLYEGLGLAQNEQIALLGFSGGAQFAHRYTMAHPQRVAKLIAVAAGWYTMPEEQTAFPLGLCTRRHLRTHLLNPERFLRVPTTVIVGGADTTTINLRRGARLDAQQGTTRVERARRFVCGLREAAGRHGIEARIHYREVPGQGHDFGTFIERGGLLALIDEALGPLTTADAAGRALGSALSSSTVQRGLPEATRDSATSSRSRPANVAPARFSLDTGAGTGGMTLGFA